MKKLLLMMAGCVGGLLGSSDECCKQKKLIERTSEYAVSPIILNRWSARAMSGEGITEFQLMTILEAGSWAPSSYNEQPERFIYGLKGTENFEKLFSLLVPFNQMWAKNGAALVLVVSRKNFSHNQVYSRTHSFDAGAAAAYMALQGSLMGLVVHGMAGFDYEQARCAFNIPDSYNIEAMFVIGHPADKEVLPAELRTLEVPSTRKAIKELASDNQFNFE
jgi:nitroreductase